MANRDEDNSTDSGHRLPMVIGAEPRQASFVRARAEPGFIAQLLATREHLAVQRALRRAPGAHASTAYRRTAIIDQKRMPAGYRRTLSA